MTDNVSGGETRPRSTFVTAAAWIAVLVLIYAMITALPGLSSESVSSKYRSIGHLVLSAAALAASFGLLKRKNWARMLFIGALACAIPWNLYAAYIAGSAYGAVTWTLGLLLAYKTLLCALFAWVIYKLCPADMRAEFE